MNIEQQRAAFEARRGNDFSNEKYPVGRKYLDRRQQAAWEAWQAAIELDRQGRGEPVAWLTSDGKMLVFADRVEDGGESGMTPLYAAPQLADPSIKEPLTVAEPVKVPILYIQSNHITCAQRMGPFMARVSGRQEQPDWKPLFAAPIAAQPSVPAYPADEWVRAFFGEPDEAGRYYFSGDFGNIAYRYQKAMLVAPPVGTVAQQEGP